MVQIQTPAHPKRATLTRSQRALSLAIALAVLAILVTAARLTPNPEGHGTHSQLGLPPCGWVIAFNKPCPTCGMTTAFAHMTHGHPIDSFLAQPLGALLAVGAAIAFWIAFHAAITGSRAPVALLRLVRPRPLWILAAIWLASWVYKIVTWPA